MSGLLRRLGDPLEMLQAVINPPDEDLDEDRDDDVDQNDNVPQFGVTHSQKA